ncbi:MAG: hypothetical protein GXP30_02145 [Verrucomicrobia bacterium]|nr:hypothetical protein [Verrucomicrobiota bacterium]
MIWKTENTSLTLSCLIVFLIWLAPFHSVAEDIMIRNVRIINREAEDEIVTVSILVEGNILKLVSKQDITPKPGVKIVDAQGGVVLGKLAVGGPANLIIVDEDPRKNFDVLLDTKTHASFAMHNGEIKKSRVPMKIHAADVSSTLTADVSERDRWFAYVPPPVALPISYEGGRKWNHWNSKWFSGTFFAAILLDRTRWQPDFATQSMLGDFDDSDTGELRGFRFGAVGALKFEQPWIYTIFAATSAFDRGFDAGVDDEIIMFDYRLDIPTPGNTTLSIGKQKEPISMERIMSMVYEPMQERSAVSDGLMRSRNFGMVLSGNAFEQQTSWAVGAFNDWVITSVPFEDSASQGVGRVTWIPWASGDESNLVHLGAAIRYSNAREGVRFFTEPEIDNSPVFIDTGSLEADGALTWNLEASWRKGPFWLAAEYTQTDVSAVEYGDPSFNGYHVTASWLLSGEMREYQRRSGTFAAAPIARPTDVGGWGTWEASARWSYLDLNDSGIDGGEMQVFSLGLNWWLKRDLNFSINWRHINLDRFSRNGSSQAMIARLSFYIE